MDGNAFEGRFDRRFETAPATCSERRPCPFSNDGSRVVARWLIALGDQQTVIPRDRDRERELLGRRLNRLSDLHVAEFVKTFELHALHAWATG